MSAKNNTPTGWVGWIYFASTMMMLLGGLQAIAGLVGIFNNGFYVVTANHLAAFNYTAWGWIDLAMGILIFFGGMALLTGAFWARVVAVMLASLSLLANMAFLEAYPWWSALMIVVDILVIYALTVHGNEMSDS
jgi:hypothetical protein